MASATGGRPSKPDWRLALRWKAQATALNVYGQFVRLASSAKPGWNCRDDVTWLLLACMPNSGSTAISKLLQNARKVVALTPSGEGQWLMPAISAPGQRWNSKRQFDPDQLRRVWLSRVSGGISPAIVFEKSPPNLCRIGKIHDALAPMERHVLVMSREPLAVCASWFRRYSAEAVVRMWRPDFAGKMNTEADHLRMLGHLYGEWAQYLVAAKDIAAISSTYEQVTADPAAFLSSLQQLVPGLEDIDPEAKLAVKDYAAGGLRNMNEEQISRLSAQQIGHIREGLEPHGDTIALLGYAV